MSFDPDLLTRITQKPGQCGERPCIRGMRIRVTDILEMLAEKVDIEDLKGMSPLPDHFKKGNSK